ncbi:hypothetical protein COV20_05925 [Candidatus Woesearchaeota archaeon CG10_big_fil_rev_8_21_14_0_10_45_16]|nr:MAG: hypothetical protein COV20_05925 [Candidatus Woesearchaeota archaeon CG10_big_fil_rev_8_21_14_0_10_45_16]
MKKEVVIAGLIILILIFTVGCDYKAYDLQDQPTSDTSLVDEIAQIEEDLAQEVEDVPVVEEEVVIPELTEEPQMEGDVQVVRVKENEFVRLKPTVTDPDNDPVTWSFTKPLDAKGDWKTQYSDAGEYMVTLTATDGKLTTSKKIKLVVERVNVPPTISGVKDITVREGEVVRFEPQVSDPNKDPITVTISEPLKGGSFVTDHTSAGQYTVTVKANDGELNAEQSFKLTVLDVNVKPEIKNVQDVTVVEGELVQIKPEVTDLDEDQVDVSISEPLGSDGKWQTSFTDHGEYFVTVTADDGKDKVTKRVKVTVQDVNKAPEIVDVSLAVN